MGPAPALTCQSPCPQLVSFLRKKDDFVDRLLQHIGTSAIMDLLLRLLTCVERPRLRQDVVSVSAEGPRRGRGRVWAAGAGSASGAPPSRPQWLNEEKIVQRLIEQIHPSKDDNVSAAHPPDVSSLRPTPACPSTPFVNELMREGSTWNCVYLSGGLLLRTEEGCTHVERFSGTWPIIPCGVRALKGVLWPWPLAAALPRGPSPPPLCCWLCGLVGLPVSCAWISSAGPSKKPPRSPESVLAAHWLVGRGPQAQVVSTRHSASAWPGRVVTVQAFVAEGRGVSAMSQVAGHL